MKYLKNKYFLVALIVIGMLLSLAAYIKHKSEDMVNSGIIKMSEGERYGVNVSEESCVSYGVEQFKSTTSPLLGSEVGRSMWLAGCLKASSKSESFCNGVPEMQDMTTSVKWLKDVCPKFGRSDPYCASYFQSVQRYCHPSTKQGAQS